MRAPRLLFTSFSTLRSMCAWVSCCYELLHTMVCLHRVSCCCKYSGLCVPERIVAMSYSTLWYVCGKYKCFFMESHKVAWLPRSSVIRYMWGLYNVCYNACSIPSPRLATQCVWLCVGVSLCPVLKSVGTHVFGRMGTSFSTCQGGVLDGEGSVWRWHSWVVCSAAVVLTMGETSTRCSTHMHVCKMCSVNLVGSYVHGKLALCIAH